MRPWSQPVRALTWAIRPDSSVGQSSCLVNSRSSVRIRLRAPKPLQLQRSEPLGDCSTNGRATLGATNPPGRERYRVVGALETVHRQLGASPYHFLLPKPTDSGVPGRRGDFLVKTIQRMPFSVVALAEDLTRLHHGMGVDAKVKVPYGAAVRFVGTFASLSPTTSELVRAEKSSGVPSATWRRFSDAGSVLERVGAGDFGEVGYRGGGPDHGGCQWACSVTCWLDSRGADDGMR